ncbi:MAG: energy transducer TonB [Bacteroidales bacterium]|nr:energy transducer TonB [Bacteroidales bacterium]
MNHGKSTCNQLKAIRKQIADANGIAYEPHECTFEGECRGTCPACEGEMRYIERELQRRQSLGKKIAVVGIATGLSAAIATTQQSCSFTSPSDRPINPPDKESSANEPTMGKVMVPPPAQPKQTKQEYMSERFRMYNGSPLWIASSESGDDYLIEDVNIIASPKKNCVPKKADEFIDDIEGDMDVEEIEFPKIEVEEDEGVEVEDSVFMGIIVEELPSFPGGDGELRKYLKDNTNYPAAALENGIQGRVFVSFVVNKEGDITDVKVARPANPSLEKEAIRVVSSMPKWTPGKLRGKAVKASFTIPINFIISEE